MRQDGDVVGQSGAEMESGLVEVWVAVLIEPAVYEAVGWGAQGYAGAFGVVEVELETVREVSVVL